MYVIEVFIWLEKKNLFNTLNKIKKTKTLEKLACFCAMDIVNILNLCNSGIKKLNVLLIFQMGYIVITDPTIKKIHIN